MFTGIYKIADICIEINSIYEEVHLLCNEYVCDDQPQVIITTNTEDVEFEKEKSNKDAELEGRVPYKYSDSYLETLAVYRKIAVALLDYDILLFHGSVVAVEDEAFLFTARSGVGKTTHSRLWLENIPGAYIVNGDKPLLKIIDNEVVAYGTPWQGKESYGANCKVKLSSICLIERSENNSIEEIDSKSMLPHLMQQAYRPQYAEYMLKTMNLLDMLIKSVKFYCLHCNMDSEAALLSFKVMQKKQ